MRTMVVASGQGKLTDPFGAQLMNNIEGSSDSETDRMDDSDAVDDDEDDGEDDYQDDEAAGQRDALWDNYKGLAQLFVVFNHLYNLPLFLSGGPGTFLADPSGRLVFGFHSFTVLLIMPGFCFVSGLFSTVNFGPKQHHSQLKFMVLWVIQKLLFEFLWLPPDRAAAILASENKNKVNAIIRDPLPIFDHSGPDWYLFCLILWRYFLPAFARLRWPLAVSVAVGIAAMRTDASLNAYGNRTFTFFPFFILGHLAKDNEAMQNISKSNVAGAICLLACAALTFLPLVDVDFQVRDWIERHLGCLYGGSDLGGLMFPTSRLRKTSQEEIIKKGLPRVDLDYCRTVLAIHGNLLFYTVSAFVVLSFAAVVPSRPKPLLTNAGVNVIYIYFGQAIPRTLGFWLAAALGANGFGIPPIVGALLVLVVPFAIWVILSQPCFAYCCRPCIEPEIERGCLPIAKKAAP